MSESAQRVVLTAAVERLFEGRLPSRWMEYAPLVQDLGRLIQPAIAIRANEQSRARRWRQNNRNRWRRENPEEVVLPESVLNAEVPPRHSAKPFSLADQERSGRKFIVRNALDNKVTFERKTVNGVKYIRLLQIPHPLRAEERFKVK